MAAMLLLLTWLAVACQPQLPEPPPPATHTPAPAAVNLGLTDSAFALGELVGQAFPPDLGELRLVPGNDRALVGDLESGLLAAALLHQVPAGHDLWFNPVAVDGLVVIVHPDNPVSILSLAQVQSLFAGRIEDWSAIGGTDAPVQLVVREPGAGPRSIFQERVMAEGRVAVTALMVGSDNQMQAVIATEPGALGYTMMGQLEDGVKALALDGIRANPTMVTSQTYPLSIPVYFVSLAEPVGHPRGLLAWLQSDAGQATIGEFYGRVR